jgi:hypothetical protein
MSVNRHKIGVKRDFMGVEPLAIGYWPLAISFLAESALPTVGRLGSFMKLVNLMLFSICLNLPNFLKFFILHQPAISQQLIAEKRAVNSVKA